MKIVIITGSPRKSGTSALLADKFIEGAKEASHTTYRFNAAFEDISPCRGCNHCMMGSHACVQKDSMNTLNAELIAADLVVFVTPLYYFGMSAQLKTVIDRFYANNTHLQGSHKHTMLMATAYDTKEWTMSALVSHYQTIVKYLKWNDVGMLLATGVWNRGDIERTHYPEQAYEMGRTIQL